MNRISLHAFTGIALSLTLVAGAFAQNKSCGNGGDCTVETPTPGCNDIFCCETVCILDQFCCDVEWDGSCVALALQNCNFSCSGAPELFYDDNAIDTTGTTDALDLTGYCDPGPYGDDFIYNVEYFTFMPTTDGLHTFSTCNQADYDTRLAILSGCDPSSVITCLDDTPGCAIYTTILAAELTSGVEVIVAVGGYSAGDSGTGTLTIELGQPELVGLRQHTVANGGDDTWYGAYSMPFGLGWNDLALTAQELGGELISIHSQELNDVAEILFNVSPASTGMAIGYYQDTTAPDYQEPGGGWRWVDDVETTYTNWYAGEPNNGGSGEDFAEIWSDGTWNDRGDGSGWSGFIMRMPEGTSNPPQDNAVCSGAIPIELGETAISNANAYGMITLPSECEASESTEVYNCAWYTFTAPEEGNWNINTCGTSWDTRIAVFDACDGNIIDCNDDACGQQSRVLLDLAQDETVTILVGGFRPGSAGDGLVTIERIPSAVTTDSISINFQGGAIADGSDGGVCYDTAFAPAGADDYLTLNWLNIRGADDLAAADWYAQGGGDNPADMVNGEGDPSGSQLIYAVNNTWRIISYPANDSERMRRGYLDSNGLGGVTATIGNVPWSSYDVVVYVGAGGSDRLGAINVNGSDPLYFLTESATGPGYTFLPMVEATATVEEDAIRSHYAVFEGLTEAECLVTITQISGNIGLCGIQILKSEGQSCPGDLNGDGTINGADFGLLLAQWGSCPGCGGDMNGDGTVNGADVGLILSYWGPCP